MVVKIGYKQTEAGVIPEDWDVCNLQDLTTKSHPIIYGVLKPGDYTPNGIPLLQIQDVIHGDIKIDKLHRIGTKLDEQYARTRLAKGDIVVSLVGTIGKVASIPPALAGANLHRNLARIRISPRNSTEFVLHYLRSGRIQASVKLATFGSTQALFNLLDLRGLLIAVPHIAEQEAIAEALSNADALNESLERLIAKKRQLKQGAMQELLTGRRRLPGFSGAWEAKRLDELGRWKGGMTPSMRNPDYWQNGTVPWVSSGDVKSQLLTSTAFAISEYAVKRKVTPLLPAKSIVIVTRSGILRKFLPVAMNTIPMAINQDIKALLPNDHVLGEYLLHSLIYNGEQILARCLKSGTTVESVEFPWLKAFTIPIPPLTEQAAIASILSEMDAEIAALEAKLTKARQLKQGMMQELLTGRIRLA